MLKRFSRPRPKGKRGFCGWQQPKMSKYMLMCCDCGLVHEFQFRIVGKRVQFRARRAEGYTRTERKRRRENKR